MEGYLTAVADTRVLRESGYTASQEGGTTYAHIRLALVVGKWCLDFR